MIGGGLRASLIIAIVTAVGPVGAAAQETWRPYDFSNTRRVELAFAVTDRGENKAGTAVMEFEDAGGGRITLYFKGTFGKLRSELSMTGFADRLYRQVLPQVMLTPAGAPLMTVLFNPYWGVFFVGPGMLAVLLAPSWGASFVGHDMSVGSSWSYGDGEGLMSFRVESECRGAGIDGVKIVLRQGDGLRAEVCVNPAVPLPLALRKVTAKGEVYEIEMKRYEARE